MADEKLRIILEVVDKASGELKKVGGSLGGIAKLAGGAALGGLTVGLAAAGTAAVGLGKGLSYAIDEAMAAEEVTAQLEAVLKSTGGTAGVTADMATDLAESLSMVTRFEDDAILSGENLLLTFTNISKDIFPETTQVMLDMSTAMDQDLKSSAIQLGKALNDPVAGLSALSRVGVLFTQEQENLIKSLVEEGNLLEAQKVILQELQKEFGGSAQAAGQTFAGQLDILKNTVANVAEAVGTAFLPALTELAGQLIAFVQSDQFQQWVEKLVQWIRDELPTAIQNAATFWNTSLKPAIEAMIPLLRDTLIPAFLKIVEILGKVLPPILTALKIGWDLQVKAINFVITTIKNMITSFQTLATAIGNLSLPDWLTPGSPTPLELGIRGINDALGSLNSTALPGFGGGLAALPAAAGPAGGGGATIVFNYSPAMSLGDRAELESKFVPFLEEALRKVNRGKV